MLKPGLYGGHKVPWAFDLDTDKQQDLSADPGVHAQAHRGSLFAIGSDDDKRALLLDLATLEQKGFVVGHAFAIAPSGHVLVGPGRTRARAKARPDPG